MTSTSENVAEFEGLLNKLGENIEEPKTYEYEDEDDPADVQIVHNKSIVLKTVTGKEYNLLILAEVVTKAWKPSGALKITYLGNGIYKVQFDLLCDLEAALQRSPWSIRDELMILERCHEDLLIEEYEFNFVSFWMHVYGLPLSMMNSQKVFNIMQKLGSPEPIDPQTASKWGKYARVRVRLDISKPIPKGMVITLNSKKKIIITFRYEKLPRLCFFCGFFGHVMKQFPHLSKKLEEDQELSTEEIAIMMNDKNRFEHSTNLIRGCSNLVLTELT